MPLDKGSIETLNKALVGPLIKVITRFYFGEVGSSIASGTTDLISRKIGDYYEQRELARRLESLSEKVVESLVSVFEDRIEGTKAIEPVCAQLAPVIEKIATSEYLLGKNLDPQTIQTDVRSKFPLPRAQFSEVETSLYNQALDRLVRCLVEIAPSLPKFTTESVSRSLQQFASFVDSFNVVAERIERIEEVIRQHAAKSNGDPETYWRYEIDYRLAIARQADYLELFGADIAAEARRHELSVAYVTLSLDTRATGNRSEYSSFDSALSRVALQKRRCLLVRGEAGSGKSTLFRWAALQSGSVAEVDRRRDSIQTNGDKTKFSDERLQTLSWQSLVPFLIRLRDFQDGLPPAHELAKRSVLTLGAEPPGWTIAQLNAGRSIIMLDGVDEVPNFQRERMAKQIVDLVEQYPDNIYLVSTRPSAVPPFWLQSAGFAEAAVNPLGERDKFELIDNWHRAVAKSVSSNSQRETEVLRQAEALRTLIRDNVALSRLATNPLLCAMICALHHGRRGNVPESPSLLCEALCQMLLHLREAEAGIDMSKFPPEYRDLSYSQKRMFVKKIAHYMVRNEASAIDAQRADQIINLTLRRMSHAPQTDGKTLRTALVERGGVLREPQQDRIDFLHNTIKEYLAAEQYVDDGDSGTLAARAFEPTWWSVITFAAANTNSNFATDLIEEVLKKADQQTSPPAQRAGRLLAVRCAASTLELPAELRATLELLTKKLFPPKNMAEAESLAFGGDEVVPQLAYREQRKAREAAACVRALRLIATPRAQAAIREYLNDSRMTVVTEVIQHANPLDAHVILTKISRGEFLDWDILRRISNLEPLRNLKEIKKLYLPSVRVQNLDALEGLSDLESLNMAHSYLRDWSSIEKLSALKFLQLTRSNITDSDLKSLRNLDSLETLHLSNTQITSLSQLEEMPKLRFLAIDGTRISSLKEMRKLSNLESLVAGSRELISLEGVEELKSLKSLRASNLSRVSSISILKELNALESISLTQIGQDVEVSQLAECKALRRLFLRNPGSSYRVLEGNFP
ncbi:NACHT domain-containing protein, partial [Reyranella sp.]|uniref:NACHT domain-containing protein n=1 Tax=Reyranella sp. TaxID=1929291 RepID=UPI003F6ECFD5